MSYIGYKPDVPGDDTVTTAKIINGAVTTAKIADDAIDGTKIAYDVSVGNTANTNSSQGDNPITTYFYEIATCANAGDAVTLPTAAAGKVVVIANNGANDADVFPATGDNIDAAGTNTAYSLTSGTNVMFISQDATDWDTISGGSGSGNSTTEGLYEHAHTISANYSITSGNNALTAGPVTIDTGVSVTVPTGSTWVIA